jgi:hypothetical protein
MQRMKKIVFESVTAVCCVLGSLACSDEAKVVGTESGPLQGAGGDGAQESGAILVAGRLMGPDGDSSVYVGAYPELPTGELDYAGMREFGNANVYTANGYIFVEEAGVVTRFSVDESYQLVEGPRMSWANYGLAEANQSYILFGSPTRAYAFAPPLGLVVVWNPETMELTGTLPLDLPPGTADGFETYAYDGVVVNGKVIWSVLTANWETYEMTPGVLLAMTDATQDAPVTYVSDERCLGGGTSLVGADGNVYLHAGGNLGIFAAYSEDPNVRTCMLRMKAGEDVIDPEFLVDYQALTGSYVSYPWVHVSGSQYLVKRWDPAVALPEDPGLYWDNAAFAPFLVDTVAGTMQPYPDVARGLFMSGIQYSVDGVTYFEVSESGAVENGTADVVALRPEGTTQQFHMSGTLTAMGRIR